MVIEGGILLRAYDIYHDCAKKIFYWAQEKATCIDNANGLYIIHLTLRGKNSVIQQMHILKFVYLCCGPIHILHIVL